MRVRVRVLGPVEVEVDGQRLDLGAVKPRRLLAVLALHRGRPVRLDTISEALWGEQPPASHAVTLQGYVSKLRKVLEPDRGAREVGTVIRTTALGYTLQLPAEAMDASRLEQAVVAGGRHVRQESEQPWITELTGDTAEIASAAADLDVALAEWRGEPYADLDDTPEVVAERDRLHETRTAAVELRETIRMHTGDPGEAARRLEVEARGQPHRERVWLLCAAALARAERRADALAALRTLRATLRDDLGLDGSSAIGELETLILRRQLGRVPLVELVRQLRVAVVDDHPVFRMGMSGLLESFRGVQVVGTAGDADAARALLDQGVDVILMDLDLGAESGIDLTRELVAAQPELRILVMTMHEEDSHVRAALSAGASGYLLKSAEGDDVHRAVLGVARGELIIGAAVARSARDGLLGAAGDPS